MWAVMPPGRRQRSLVRIDEAATSRRLQELLLSKNVGEDPLAEAANAAATAAITGGGGEAGPCSPALGGLGGLSRSTVMASVQAPRRRHHEGVAATPPDGSVSEGSFAANPTASLAQAAAVAALKEQQARQLEIERKQYVERVCTPTTRHDVQQWLGKIFTMTHEARMETQAQEAKERRRRRVRARAANGGATSDAGLSGFSAMSGMTADTGTGTTATATALLAAGGSIAASYHPPRSAHSDESLVVHNDVEEPLSVKERLQGYLAHRIPELDSHVNGRIAQRVEALQKEVDDDVANRFLRETSQRRVFDGRANYVRWQGTRHQALQKRLDQGMPKWIIEAVEDWDSKKALETRKEKVSQEDQVFDYLTKRAAHIDSEKQPAEIPVFKTLHASYSLPSMWRDNV